MVDSTDFGVINLENVDSFTTSVRLISQKKDFLKKIKLDTIVNEEERYNSLKIFLMPLYDLFHGTWIDFHNDSTAIEHIKGTSDNFTNLNRTFEFNTKTNHLIFDKHSRPEELEIKMLSDDTLILRFYSEGLNLLVKKER